VLTSILTDIMDQSDIGEDESVRLKNLCQMFDELGRIFINNVRYVASRVK
jgi:hypothetical protein